MQQRIFSQFIQSRKVSTDTRKISEGSIFFCLKGANFNGNQFAHQAMQLGASLVVADEPTGAHDPRIVQVPDVLKALQNLACDYRKTFDIPFIAITGSNGKTTTKELMRDVLRMKYKVHATEGNLNNHIGVPLTLLAMPQDCEIAIIEMGANHQGEIASYCEYALPNFALITNIGKAHLEGFGGVEGVKKGKKELYDFVSAHKGKVFVNTELPILKEVSASMDIIPYGFNTGEFSLKLLSETPSVVYEYTKASLSLKVDTALAGAYNLYNIASAVAVGQYFKVGDEKIHEAIASYVPDNNRSQLMRTASNTLIMDAYNANPSSMEHALISLKNQTVDSKFFVIGDMRELGLEASQEHKAILQKATELGLQGITVGEHFKNLEKDFLFPAFSTNNEAMEYLRSKGLKDCLILIKGSRGIKLEEVVTVL
jgi:UDP-N-acetylmuramoyl-tripeptide--D-alanyl-D-alanine ligase